jgi:predicted RNase H-like nuclease
VGTPVDWKNGQFKGSIPDVGALLDSVRVLAGAIPDVIALDMPVSMREFSSRRAADRAISAAFGAKGCSTHSPSAERPGRVGSSLMQVLITYGYLLAGANRRAGTSPAVIEVYPHPALLALLACDYRLPYKVGKSKKFWPDASIDERKGHLLEQFERIQGGLRGALGDTETPLPPAATVRRLNELKRYEDALDALTCAWVGARYLEGNATPYGDDDAAIWVPGRG